MKSESSAVHAAPADPGRAAIVRQELDRVLQGDAFGHSRRSQDLFRFVVEKALAGEHDRLKERSIGIEVFGRDPDYDTTQNAIVRVAANDVRKRLAEHYRVVPPGGVRIGLHSGSYVPEFEWLAAPVSPLPLAAAAAPAAPSRARWYGAAAALVLCGFAVGLAWRSAAAGPANPPWPLARVFDEQHRTILVVADSNAGMLGVIRGKPIQLEEYLQPGFVRNSLPAEARGSGIGNVVAGAQLTSFADVAMVLRIARLAGLFADRMEVRFARDLRLRELQDGNFILLGSPSSNPWVSVFADQLNFHEEVSFPEPREFVNARPAAGEQARYRAFPWTGSAGEEYATVALLPTESHRGNVLILQGLHQEGTEAAGSLMATEEGQRKLRQSLGGEPRWFEALLRTRAVAGATSSTEVVATRKKAE